MHICGKTHLWKKSSMVLIYGTHLWNILTKPCIWKDSSKGAFISGRTHLWGILIFGKNFRWEFSSMEELICGRTHLWENSSLEKVINWRTHLWKDSSMGRLTYRRAHLLIVDRGSHLSRKLYERFLHESRISFCLNPREHWKISFPSRYFPFNFCNLK